MSFENYTIKAKYLLPPFLKITLYTVGGLALFRWIFSIYFNSIEINEELWELWLPLFLPMLPIFIWLNPRTTILVYKNARSEGSITIIALFTMIMMGIITQKYITVTTSKIIALNNVESISKFEKARYYYLDTYEIDTTRIRKYSELSESKFGNKTIITMYFVTPFKTQYAQQPIQYWYGIQFKKLIYNKLTGKQKDNEFKGFTEMCNREVRNHNYYASNLFERLPKSVDSKKYLIAAQQQSNLINNKSNIILRPVFERPQSNNRFTLIWVFYTFLASLTIFMFFLIFPKYSKRLHDKKLTYRMYIHSFKKVFYIK